MLTLGLRLGGDSWEPEGGLKQGDIQICLTGGGWLERGEGGCSETRAGLRSS